MTTTPAGKLAVIISTYQNPAMLRLVLEGYRRQTCRDFCIYIADDGSGAETRQLIEAYKHDFPAPITHLWHEDRGFRKARIHNRVIREVTEPYILLTDGDCIPLPNLVSTHLRLASHGHFISGRRILLSEALTRRLLNGEEKLADNIRQWLRLRLRGEVNRLLPMFTPPYLSAPNDKLAGIRGCHLSLWRDDLVAINGFDESYEGWGREDSDLVARLLHAGIRRRNLQGTPVLHLWHRENPRQKLDANDALLKQCLDERRIKAIVGLTQLAGQDNEPFPDHSQGSMT
ncbi:MAG TPA: glycosyltransferase family 2 protein [Mariprofundaceae bacterium]|nr:glycosyltransferase family 2 protein [Mariprofundaceae bacterium]